ncbi:MAG: C-GCAxxG-C-C family protein, partial [Deltaproteobacteria bacterium]
MDLSGIDQYPSKEAFVEEIKNKTYETELKCHGCAQVIVQTFMDVLGVDNPDVSLAASPFFAGIALTGNTCGALIGSLIMLGIVFGRKDVYEGMPGLLKGVKPMRKLVKTFRQNNQYLNCTEITGTDLADPEKAEAYVGSGGLERCAGIMADAGGYAAELIYHHYRAEKA